jgi:hypothetical protein
MFNQFVEFLKYFLICRKYKCMNALIFVKASMEKQIQNEKVTWYVKCKTNEKESKMFYCWI